MRDGINSFVTSGDGGTKFETMVFDDGYVVTLWRDPLGYEISHRETMMQLGETPQEAADRNVDQFIESQIEAAS